MRLAHVSDLHLLDLQGVGIDRFLNRRAIGAVNLLLSRAREYRPEIVETLIDDLLREEVDHIAISGDLSNLALESEFERVFHLLRLLGGWERLSVVPGNHDYYTFQAADTRKFEKYFHPFMFQRDFSDLNIDVYPYTKRLGDILLVGLNSATRTIPPFSYGTLGHRQLELVDKILGSPEAASAFTVLLLHHAMHRRDPVTEATTGLVGRERLLEIARRHRVGLILHGHDHRGQSWRLEQEGHATQVICCGSSSRLTREPALIARYRVITIEQGRVRRIETRVYDPTSRRFTWE